MKTTAQGKYIPEPSILIVAPSEQTKRRTDVGTSPVAAIESRVLCCEQKCVVLDARWELKRVVVAQS